MLQSSKFIEIDTRQPPSALEAIAGGIRAIQELHKKIMKPLKAIVLPVFGRPTTTF